MSGLPIMGPGHKQARPSLSPRSAMFQPHENVNPGAPYFRWVWPPRCTNTCRTADLKQEAEARWQISRRYAKTRRIDPTLSKNQTSILIQLRTGHAPLQQHLFRLRKAESAMCPTCGTNEETVIHYLLHCPTWKRARAPLRRALPAFRTLLRILLSSPEALPTLFGYIKATGRTTEPECVPSSTGTGIAYRVQYNTRILQALLPSPFFRIPLPILLPPSA
ncbi:predicted protein [Postia placenta Mad-698-R]|nr:predicted protein [Postia placenta Mad-698-R]